MTPRRRWLAWAAAALASPAAWAAGAPPVRVQMRIDLREAIAAGQFDPAAQRIGVRGGVLPLDWGRSLLAEATAEAGVYALGFDMQPAATGGQPVAYKFKIEALDGPSAPDAGWEPGPNRSFSLPEAQSAAGGELRLQRAWGEATEPPPPRRAGRIELHELPGPEGAPRAVQVWLPPGWAPGGPPLPVLLLLDGDNQFDARAAGAEWQMDEHAQAGVAAGRLRPFLAVAISQGATRLHEYTPWPDGGWHAQPGGGGLPVFADWLTDRLLPWLRQHYGASAAAADTAVGGASLGGLAAMWLLAERPAHFGAGLVASPSVWWAGQRLLQTVRQAAWPVPPRVWLYIGGREGRGMLPGAQALREVLAARGVAPAYVEVAEGPHSEVAWAAQVPAMLEFLYGHVPH